MNTLGNKALPPQQLLVEPKPVWPWALLSIFLLALVIGGGVAHMWWVTKPMETEFFTRCTVTHHVAGQPPKEWTSLGMVRIYPTSSGPLYHFHEARSRRPVWIHGGAVTIE